MREQITAPANPSFSFVHRGKRRETPYQDSEDGLRVLCESRRFDDFPAIDWLLRFENAGAADTGIVENVLPLDLTIEEAEPCFVHHLNGAPVHPTDFEMRRTELSVGEECALGGLLGRSSYKDFPFFRIDLGSGVLIVAVGWSGQWQARIRMDDNRLRITAGMERTHFLLHPSESVRSPRILTLFWPGSADEAHNQFRRLLAKHYLAPLKGERPTKPFFFCNTCFTRGGSWLNECNEENQISLIRALAPLGIESVITDAGWFTGGWPFGAGNWDARKDAYPNGIGPVAAAAQENGITYGLWFEPERVVKETKLHSERSDWLLYTKSGDSMPAFPGFATALLNLGVPEARDYFIDIVAEYMRLPGFSVYRQDFNADPLQFWLDTDTPERQGITEMRYIEGLYAYWDKLAELFPDGFREECASGGRRIDLETIMRMHAHQKSDLWFNNEVDQASLLALSHYLPNGVISVPVNRLDDYSFHSALPCSLILGWIADDAEFDTARAKQLADRYLAVRHLLNGDFYALTGYSRDLDHWSASQYHRPDLGEGMVLVFRRAECASETFAAALKGLEADAIYEVVSLVNPMPQAMSGRELMRGLNVSVANTPGTDLIRYRVGKPS